MKMPDPIIEPTTIIVPSNKPMARTKPGSDFAPPFAECLSRPLRDLQVPASRCIAWRASQARERQGYR